MGISLSPNLVSLEDIPTRYVDDPQLALANVRKHVPGVLAPPWVEPAVPPDATVAEVDALRREAVYQWVVALCQNAGASIPVRRNNTVAMALAGARSVPTLSGMEHGTGNGAAVSGRSWSGLPDECTECFRPNNKHFTNCSRWAKSVDAGDRLLANLRARRRGITGVT